MHSLGVISAAVLLATLLPASVSAATACPYGNGVATTSTVSGSTRTIRGSGCPEYSPYNQTTPNTPNYQNFVHNVPAKPILCSTPQYNNDPTGAYFRLGTIGIAVNGIPVYDASDALLRNAYQYEGATFDGCRGHASPQGYHYHTGSSCEFSNPTGAHSTMFAIMGDGFPLYGPYGASGVLPSDLDECWGHSSDLGFYHYHLPQVWTDYPFTVKCLKGDISGSTLPSGKPSPAATCTAVQQYDLTGLAIPWTPNAANTNSPPPSPPGSNRPPPAGAKPPPVRAPPGQQQPAPAGRPPATQPAPAPVTNPNPAPGPANNPAPVVNPAPTVNPNPVPAPTPKNGPGPGPRPSGKRRLGRKQ